jgi:hypothetical protein
VAICAVVSSALDGARAHAGAAAGGGAAVTRRNPFAGLRKWRAKDKHTGIGKVGQEPYTYEHVGRTPESPAEAYRVETYIPFVKPTPLHRNVYYVTAQRLPLFLDEFAGYAEMIIDVRPVTIAAALDEIETFKLKAVRP